MHRRRASALASAIALVASLAATNARADTECHSEWDPEAAKPVVRCETRHLACEACALGAAVPAMATIPLDVLAALDGFSKNDPRNWRSGLLGTWAALGLVQVVSGVALIAANEDYDKAGGRMWGSFGIALGLPGAVLGTWGLLRGTERRAWPLQNLFGSSSIVRPMVGVVPTPTGNMAFGIGASGTM